MTFYHDYLDDAAFLKQVDTLTYQQQYVRVILLDWEENYLNTIQGKVSQGSININGSSIIRRTANLTVLLDTAIYDEEMLDHNVLINKKIGLQIGILNTTEQYTDEQIIWFPQGVYVINDVTISNNNSGLQMALSLKDKMCLLNGDIGGTLPSAITFDEIDTTDAEGLWVVQNPTLYQIILELVHHFGGEQYSNIIIDLDTRAKSVMRWFPSKTENGDVYGKNIQIINSSDNGYNCYELITTEQDVNHTQRIYGMYEDVGYVYTDFTWPRTSSSSNSGLTCKAGQSITSVLQKIKKKLGNYEFFYDVNGVFRFQQIQNYLNTTKVSTIINKCKNGKIDNIDYLLAYGEGQSCYNFSDTNIITSFQNAPKLNNIKNDFVVWGQRGATTKDSSATKTPIRYHLAIDSKPPLSTEGLECVAYVDKYYKTDVYEDDLLKLKQPFKFASKDNFPKRGAAGVFYYDSTTEQTYAWVDGKYVIVKNSDEENNFSELVKVYPQDWRQQLYVEGSHASAIGINFNYYYTELAAQWPKLYNVMTQEWRQQRSSTSLDYYLDFIDTDAKISQFSVQSIGRRSKVVEDTSINCVFEPDIPDYYFINRGEDADILQQLKQECKAKGVKYVLCDANIYDGLSTGGIYNSAFNYVRDLLYQYTSYNSTITLQTLPILHLDANQRITVEDTSSGISGDYIIQTMTIPLGLGTSSITANQVLQKF